MNARGSTKHVVIVGGGFAGLGCALKLAKNDNLRVTLIDKRNYSQFQPLLYQLATAILGTGDDAASIRHCFLVGKLILRPEMTRFWIADGNLIPT